MPPYLIEKWDMDTSDAGNSQVIPASVPRDSNWNELPMPLRECGEIAVLRLSSALSDALVQTSEQLFTEATEALTAHEREAFLDAAEFARHHRRGIAYDFMKHFEARYVRACQRRHDKLQGHRIDFDAKALRIVEHHVLDDSLAPGQITEAIQNACWQTLQSLTTQFRHMLNGDELMPNDLPLGPRIIEAATSDAIRDQPWRHKAKQRLAHALRWPLAARVNRFYRDMVDHLSARDLKVFALNEPADGQAGQAANAGSEEPGQESDSHTTAPAAVPQASASTAPDSPEVASPQNQAAMAAADEVARCLRVPGLPQAAMDFLTQHWSRYLAGVHGNQGNDGTSWRVAVQTMDVLVWALTARIYREDAMHLMAAMPDLVRRLSVGMDALGLRGESRNALLVLLNQRHGQLERDFLRTPAPAPSNPPGPPDPSVSTPVTQTSSPSSSSPDAPEINALKVGIWMAFRDTSGLSKDLKLAWISPQRSLFLLTNRQGERALSLSAKDITRLLREGTLAHLANGQAQAAEPRNQPPRKTA